MSTYNLEIIVYTIISQTTYLLRIPSVAAVNAIKQNQVWKRLINSLLFASQSSGLLNVTGTVITRFTESKISTITKNEIINIKCL